MRITERQLRRIIRESVASMLNEGEERQIVGPDYGGKQPLSVGAKILALVGKFRDGPWRHRPSYMRREKASEEQQYEIEAFQHYATVIGDDGQARVATDDPALKAALDAFIATWASDPVWHPIRAVDAADKAYEAHAPEAAAKDNSMAKDAAESAPHAARHRAMTGEPAHEFERHLSRAKASGESVRESKRRLPSRKLW